MAIQAPVPFIYRNRNNLDAMDDDGGLPADVCQYFQQQQMVTVPWVPRPPPPLPMGTSMIGGFPLPSSSTSVSSATTDLSDHLILGLMEEQRNETDQILRQQNDLLAAGLRQQTNRHTVAIIRSLEFKASSLLRQREEVLTKANMMNRQLELRLKSAEEERTKWQGVARANEAMAISLSNALEQVRDSCHSSNDSGPTESAARGAANEPTAGMGSTQRWCRVCVCRDACMVLLPCNHLCCCEPCAALLEACPFCGSVKIGSVEVLLE
ncbi:protein binding zinc ion binding [Musa troglodytarum]|uniref:Protein binding zinc ion binding n=1 Tax=Musa troglodytarum TaxID=320322 RepID=A0A9E7FEP5_9LILI|nr:protein binding zinc ion binding [Musa troglodytarum]